MTDFLLDMALGHFDFSGDEIAQIKTAIPKIQYAADLIKQHKTLINELIDLGDMVAARVNKRETK